MPAYPEAESTMDMQTEKIALYISYPTHKDSSPVTVPGAGVTHGAHSSQFEHGNDYTSRHQVQRDHPLDQFHF